MAWEYKIKQCEVTTKQQAHISDPEASKPLHKTANPLATMPLCSHDPSRDHPTFRKPAHHNQTKNMQLAVLRFVESSIVAWSFEKPLIIGLSGPQGLGKLTVVRGVLAELADRFPDLEMAGFSMDDFYLSHREQSVVSQAAAKEGNTLLQGRGLPGTHDTALLLETFRKISAGEAVRVPEYDKLAFGGVGDRKNCDEPEKWRFFRKLDVVLFEGWFNGFRAVEPAAFPAVYMAQPASGAVHSHKLYHVAAVNEKLREFEPVWGCFSKFVYFATPTVSTVYQWRAEQEEQLWREKGSGMLPEQVRHFVNRYMPVYALYYSRLGPVAGHGNNLAVAIDASRHVLSLSVS